MAAAASVALRNEARLTAINTTALAAIAPLNPMHVALLLAFIQSSASVRAAAAPFPRSATIAAAACDTPWSAALVFVPLLEAKTAEVPSIVKHAALPLVFAATPARAFSTSTDAARFLLVLDGPAAAAAALPVPRHTALFLVIPCTGTLAAAASTVPLHVAASILERLEATAVAAANSLHSAAPPPLLLLQAVPVPAAARLHAWATLLLFFLEAFTVAATAPFNPTAALVFFLLKAIPVAATAPLHPRAAPPFLVAVDTLPAVAGAAPLPHPTAVVAAASFPPHVMRSLILPLVSAAASVPLHATHLFVLGVQILPVATMAVFPRRAALSIN